MEMEKFKTRHIGVGENEMPKMLEALDVTHSDGYPSG